MNRLVAQAFQPAGLPDFRVRWTRNGRLESRPNPQARKPALRTRFGSWSQCAPNMTCRLSMNLKTLGLIPKSLRISGSWSQCATKKACRLPMNRSAELQRGEACPRTRRPGDRRSKLAVHGPNARAKVKEAFHEPRKR